MAWLLDTNILGRLANSDDPFHLLTVSAIVSLHRKGEVLHITPQVLIEFRCFSSRPVEVNGLGLTAYASKIKADLFELSFPLIAESPDIFEAWKSLVEVAGTIGKQVHDARLLAVCGVHGITHLLTFNVKHFEQLAKFMPEVKIVDPRTL